MTTSAPGLPIDAREAREGRRQRAVESLGLTEARRYEQLDRVARIAKATFGVEFSSITVFDNDRALFVGGGGFEDVEAPRSASPCQLVVESGDIVTTDDARTDARFDDIANIRVPNSAFYVGHPLKDINGNVVGSLCLVDQQPRLLTDREMDVFRDLAGWAQDELLADADSLRARDTQRSLLPAAPLDSDGIHVVGVCVPALSVGGDYYDYGMAGPLAHIAIGDVMGKGTAAAIIGASTRAACRAVVPTIADGAGLGRGVERIERAIIRDLERTGTFVTYFHAVIDPVAATLHYVDAGAGLSLLVRADGSTEQLTGSGMPLGIQTQEHIAHSRPLQSGDRLILVSDGLLDVVEDQTNWIEELDTLVRASSDGTDVLRRVAALSLARIPIDDVTVVVVEYRP
ncbi:serine phosphatase RsbU (regulator of sigma subunit) [Conyzicola lurida]|uniref:Serine phosphatase RsbU (Regulator of sigma subunit) n=1 Tax=Conyzicola lurida TaxID=1172621 RepID=A0A841AQ09_9MICO|nr:SpoIIE family protein phosphatase [Conyzicola lurida]MBB5844374.1 serine phosphatase RsbU (regulator of sigma subunit) [Conyzicola lurida]